MSLLPSYILVARRRLAETHADLQARHRAGGLGKTLCKRLTETRDEIVLNLFDAALDDLAPRAADALRARVALVAHGGYGRHEAAPWSDLDLMILDGGGVAARVASLAQRFWRDLVDVGFTVGGSVRTPNEAAAMAYRDPLTATSLVEARLLAGSATAFTDFSELFRRHLRRQSQKLMAAIVDRRDKERRRFGETVYLLEPNVKRSPGGLRDLHLLRWIGLVRYGATELGDLAALGALADEDAAALARAGEFLSRLRNEMHFHAGRAVDVLDRAEQVRIAERFGYAATAGQLPVERFMQRYFHHSRRVHYAAARFVAHARSRVRLDRLLTTVFGHGIEPGLVVGPRGVAAAPRRASTASDDLARIVRMADLASRYDKPISPETWEAVRRAAPRLAKEPSPEACRHFLSLLDHPAQLAPLLHDLHAIGTLERFVPAMARARGLLQFNEYHQYTVDEHCLRAVGFAAKLFFDMGPLGRTYRAIADKRVLHLSLLLHDLGKGLAEDHSEAGLRIASGTAARLGLSASETKTLEFLVHKHLLMNHLALHRDTLDEQLVVGFAREVGSPELLAMLFVLTASDLAAVGPGVWDAWKAKILTDLFDRTMRRLAGDSPATTPDDVLRRRREAVLAELGPAAGDPRIIALLDALPSGYLLASESREAASDLRLILDVRPGDVTTEGHYLPETVGVQYTVGTHEQTAPGVFHRLTGALTSHGLEIRSAEIHTLAGGVILDRFWVRDLDYEGEPPRHRIEEINAALAESLRAPAVQTPAFRSRRRADAPRHTTVGGGRTRVIATNAASDRSTILDVFTEDRLGLLHATAQTIFEMGLSVWRAKISTYGSHVVNVFYVTDEAGRKIEDLGRLGEIERRLEEQIEMLGTAETLTVSAHREL
jgi:[protein-PII] uridylyltransferase